MKQYEKIERASALYRSLLKKYENTRSVALRAENMDELKKSWSRSRNYFLMSLRAEALSYRLCTSNAKQLEV